jgi:hypothetical protein
MPDRDLIGLTHDAMNNVYERALKAQRDAEKDLVTRPLVPLTDDPDKVVATKERTRQQRRSDYLAWRNDPVRVQASIAQHSANLPPEAPIPRVIVETLLDGERLVAEEAD